jgi:hypothetical protein
MAEPVAPVPSAPPGDRSLRGAAAVLAIALAAAAFLLRDVIDPRLQAVFGIICFIAIVAAFSTNLRAVSWKTVAWGMALQLAFALFILKLEIGGVRPGFALFTAIGNAVKQFLEFTNAGSMFVFGVLADQAAMGSVFGNGFRLRLHGAADDHLRLVVLHGALLLRRAADHREAAVCPG